MELVGAFLAVNGSRWGYTGHCNRSKGVNEGVSAKIDNLILIYLLTAIGLTPGGNSTVHIYTQTIHRTTQSTQTIHRTTQSTQTIHRITQLTNWEECGPCPAFACYNLAFTLQLRKSTEKPQSGYPKNVSWHDETEYTE
jgi:hypothetical protein